MLVTPRVHSVAESASNKSFRNLKILPTPPAQHPASKESSQVLNISEAKGVGTLPPRPDPAQ